MKRRDLIKQIERAAGDAGVSWALVGEGGNHSVFSLNGRRVEIPRHREINELTANGFCGSFAG